MVSFLMITALSCDKENSDQQKVVSLEHLPADVQKGPFMNGTSVDVAGLTPELNQTGKNFNKEVLIESFGNHSDTVSWSKISEILPEE